MSDLSKWWHDTVDKLSVSDKMKKYLHDYGLYVIWGVGILAALLLLRAIF